MVPPSSRRVPEEEESIIFPLPASPTVISSGVVAQLLTRIFQERASIFALDPTPTRSSLKFFVNG